MIKSKVSIQFFCEGSLKMLVQDLRTVSVHQVRTGDQIRHGGSEAIVVERTNNMLLLDNGETIETDRVTLTGAYFPLILFGNTDTVLKTTYIN